MTDAELVAYARGWLAGQERAYLEGFGDGVDVTLNTWTECVKRANRRSTTAAAAKTDRVRV